MLWHLTLRHGVWYGSSLLSSSLQIAWQCLLVTVVCCWAGAKGCEVIVSGKIRGARAKAMKFMDGYMLTTGQ